MKARKNPEQFKMLVPCRRTGCTGKAHLYNLPKWQEPRLRQWRITCTGCVGHIISYPTRQEALLRYYCHNEVDDLNTGSSPPVPVIVFDERRA